MEDITNRFQSPLTKIFSCLEAFWPENHTKDVVSSSCVKCQYAKERDNSIKKRYGAVKERENDHGVALQGNPM